MKTHPGDPGAYMPPLSGFLKSWVGFPHLILMIHPVHMDVVLCRHCMAWHHRLVFPLCGKEVTPLHGNHVLLVLHLVNEAELRWHALTFSSCSSLGIISLLLEILKAQVMCGNCHNSLYDIYMFKNVSTDYFSGN